MPGNGVAMNATNNTITDWRELLTVNVIVILIVAMLFSVWLVIQSYTPTIDDTVALAEGLDSHLMLYVASFLFMIISALTPVPAELAALTNAIVMSPGEAFLVTWISAMTGAWLGYELGAINGLNPCKSARTHKICCWLDQYGFYGLLLMRMLPVVPFFVLNLSAGIFKFDRREYLIASAIGIIPAVSLLVFVPQLFL